MIGYVGRLCLIILIMLSGPWHAAEDQLRMITATGRAVISHGDALNEAKNSALEDALYWAALSGGAKIDGFSSVQADTALDDHFVVRPSSKIVDYNIIDEMHDDQHYQVTVQAAVGSVEREGVKMDYWPRKHVCSILHLGTACAGMGINNAATYGKCPL